MASITTWTRLEPVTRSNDMQAGLEARVEDPLWLLGRQWQMSEFKGDDAGSLVLARLEAEGLRLTRYRSGPFSATGAAPVESYDERLVPLETLVEREPASRPGIADLRWAADAGLEFARLLVVAGATAQVALYLSRYAFAAPTDGDRATLDPESLALQTMLAGRVIDGARLYQDLLPALRPATGTPSLPTLPAIPPAAVTRVLGAARIWLDWYDTLLSQPATDAAAWVPERMEYEFAVSAETPTGPIVLAAPEYTEGRLDWYAFTHRATATLGAPGGAARRDEIRQSTIPVPVSYPGMPANRWWEFEDAQIDWGAIETGPEDLVRMMLVEFSLIYGNDWFVIPVELGVGTVCRIGSLVVTNSFGETIPIPPFAQAGGAGSTWRMFTISPDRRAPVPFTVVRQDLFVLPPTLGPVLSGPPIEDVLLFRDEMANMAWAVERIVESRSGRPLDRHDIYYARGDNGGAPAPASGALRYRLMSSVPDYWIPLVPVPSPADGAGVIRLRRGVIPSPTGELVRPLGRILGTAPLDVRDEEVPRAGARVSRSYQCARWIDGSTHLWIGRRKGPGGGEGSSGLSFDTASPPPRGSPSG